MYLKTLITFLPFLAATSVLATQGTQTAVAVSGTPHVTYPPNGAFVFCSAQDCTGTCDVVNVDNVQKDVGNTAPGFKSVYWYNPHSYAWVLFACVGYYDCASRVQLGAHQCYNLYENGAPQSFTEYWYVVNVVP